jgi:arylsulfatase
VTVDTLRADHLHSYGFPQSVTPGMDALAARGVRFERAIAAASSTIPSHASLMTSRYARQHSAGARNGDTRLEGLPTLAAEFARADFATAAFISNAVLQRRSGLDSGFAVYDEHLPANESSRGVPERLAPVTVAAALEWLSDRADDERVFLWVHLQDPHGPYTPPESWIERVEPIPGGQSVLPVANADVVRRAVPRYQELEDATSISDYLRRYAAEVAYADDAISVLTDAVFARGPAAILLTSDHGESLGEDGYYFQHAHSTTPDLARVPLLLAAPGLEPGIRIDLVHHVDVAPTLLELAGLPPLEGSSGLALGPYLRSGEALPLRTVFCDTRGEASAYRLDGYISLRGPANEGLQQALASEEAGGGERITVREYFAAGDAPATRDPELEAMLRAYVRSSVPVAPASLSETTLERLRALGYFGDSR